MDLSDIIKAKAMFGGSGGGGELTTANMTFITNSDSKDAELEGIFVVRDAEYGDWLTSNLTVKNGDIVEAVLLNGTTDIKISTVGIDNVTVTGAEITSSDESYYYITVTTACTVNITFRS